MDNARVYEGVGWRGRRKLCGFWSLVHRKQGREGGGEGLSLVVTCSGYFESNKSTLSVLLVLRFAGVCSCAYTPYYSRLRLTVSSKGPGGSWILCGVHVEGW